MVGQRENEHSNAQRRAQSASRSNDSDPSIEVDVN